MFYRNIIAINQHIKKICKMIYILLNDINEINLSFHNYIIICIIYYNIYVILREIVSLIKFL
jgi:hypothetical protein